MASWVISPVVSGVLGFLIYYSIHFTILRRQDPSEKTRFWAPVYIFGIVVVISLSILFKGLEHIDLFLTLGESLLLSCGLGVVAIVPGRFLLDPGITPSVPSDSVSLDSRDREQQMVAVDKTFGFLQIISACAVAFAHGSNDVANRKLSTLK